MPREQYKEVLEEPNVPFDTEYFFTSDYCKECDHCFECLRESKEINVTHFSMYPETKCERKEVTKTVIDRMSWPHYPDPINHKGENCPHSKGLICQEGYCSDCSIFRELQDWERR